MKIKIKYFLVLAVFCYVLFSCISLRIEILVSGGKEAAIRNAITSFSEKCTLNKDDSIFLVIIQDTLYEMALNRIDERNMNWTTSKSHDDIYAISICQANKEDFQFIDNIRIGDKGKLPSKFIEKNGTLFLWSDNNYPLTEEIFFIYSKFHILKRNIDGVITPFIENNDSTITPFDSEIDDKQKAAHYYVCKNNISKYKRIITNKAIGYYKVPILKCD